MTDTSPDRPKDSAAANSGVVPGSGDAAVSAADDRASATRGLNISDIDDLPIPEDTANLRLGPELHPDCLSLLPLVGVWRGTGNFGNEPRADGSTDDFGQQIVISHDGRPFLRYESVLWHPAGQPGSAGEPGSAGQPGSAGADGVAPGSREVGWLRPQPDGSIELLLAHSEGRLEIFYGQPRSVTTWALSTDGVLRSPGAAPVVGATRLYGITPDGRLAYVEERAHDDAELAPHASALLTRLVG